MLRHSPARRDLYRFDLTVRPDEVHDVEEVGHHAAMIRNDADPVADARPVRRLAQLDDAVLFAERGDRDLSDFEPASITARVAVGRDTTVASTVRAQSANVATPPATCERS